MSAIEQVMAGISDHELRIAVHEYLKSDRINSRGQRELLGELKKVSSATRPFIIDERTQISKQIVCAIIANRWDDLIAAVVEIAHESPGTLDHVSYHLCSFMKDSGFNKDMYSAYETKYGKSIIKSLLALAGYRFKRCRDLEKGFSNMVAPVDGTGMMTVADRIDMAMKRCELMRPQTYAKQLNDLI